MDQRDLFMEVGDAARTPRPSYYFMMRCLLCSRIETGLGSNESGYDEDVNIYMAHLLNSFSDPRYLADSRRYLSKYDTEVFERLAHSDDARLKYTIYKANADFLLVSIGIFENPGAMLSGRTPNARPRGARAWTEPTEEAYVGRGKTYYHFAYSYSQQVHRRNAAVSDVLEKLSLGFDKYTKILSHLRGEYFNLIDALSRGEVYHLERSVDKEGAKTEARQKIDEFLDVYAEWMKTGSDEARGRMERIISEIRALDPEFRFRLPGGEGASMTGSDIAAGDRPASDGTAIDPAGDAREKDRKRKDSKTGDRET
jgi:hypothetical protein